MELAEPPELIEVGSSAARIFRVWGHAHQSGEPQIRALFAGIEHVRQCGGRAAALLRLAPDIHFDELGRLRELHGGAPRLPELSMGMTSDLEHAIAAGATIVRIGTAIFGERPKAGQ